MAKRFIDTDLFRKPLMRSLEAPYKALWIYLLCECDHAGIWDVELDVAQMRMGMKIDPDKALEKLRGSAVPIDGGAKWFLPEFIAFQYGTLNPANRVHASVLSALSKYGIDPNDTSQNKGLASSLQGAKDKDKDKDKENSQKKERAIENASEYPDDFPEAMRTPEALAAWTTWEAARKEKGKPITHTSRRLQLADCQAWGTDRAIAALLHSAKGNYQGLFEPKPDRSSPQAVTPSAPRENLKTTW